MGGCGISTAALASGGYSASGGGTNVATTEYYNGTNWTELNDLNTARNGLDTSGTYTAALAFGGNNPSPRSALTEDWNGASWSEVADLSTARTNIMRSGTSSSAACIGGATAAPANTGATEEWSSSSDVVKTLTD